MGNAGGFSSLSPSTPSTQHGANVDANDGQLQEISRNLDVSKTDVQLLWQRFLALGPEENGLLDRAVFQSSPYTDDIFCRQIWKRFSGSRDGPNKISFESFAKSMIWWQKAPINHKLQLLFSWMRDVDGITPHVLSKILKYILPTYQENELKIIAERMNEVISHSSDHPAVVKQEDFLDWMCQLPQQALSDALHFRITNTDSCTRT